MARVKRRRYQSEIRAASARKTRASITAAARALFAARGYAGTPIEAIARKAGVAVPTIYAVFGTKAALLESLMDSMDAEADVDALHAALARPPKTHPEAIAAFLSRLFTRSADVLAAANAAGDGDSALRGLARKARARHQGEVRQRVREWRAAGALRSGMTESEAADTLNALTSPAMFAELRSAGWSRARYERWLAEAIKRLILDI